MSKRLVIDLDRCDGCASCRVRCTYFYRPRAGDHGVLGLRERATFALVCRRCKLASCIEACAFGALERDGDGVLQRHNLRCVSCTLCAQACPFGTIYADLLTFYQSPCDYCIGRVADEAPPCAGSCGRGAIEYRTVQDGEEGVYMVDDHLAARAVKWIGQEGER